MPKKPAEAPRKKGRPSQYSRALAGRICDAIKNGMSARQAAAQEGVPIGTLYEWIDKHPAFSEQYARARAIALQSMEDELTDIRHRLRDAWCDPDTGYNHVQALRAEADVVKWQLVKMLPKKYGDKAAVELTGAEGAPLIPGLTDDKVAAIAAKVAEARARVEADGKGQPPAP